MVNEKDFKIAIIVAWFGKLPEYFPAWMYSCSKNPDVDFLVYTDQDISGAPKNVKIKPSSLEKLRKLAEDKINIPCSGLVYPYKLCDLRPFYGLVFGDDIKGYSHWGHCDIDLIFGDFEHFITSQMLSEYDKIFRYGHLTIYRNTEQVNLRPFCKGALFSAADVMKNKEHYSYDEVTGIDRVYRKNKWSYYTKKPYVDVSVRHLRTIRLNDSSENFEKQAFAYESGKVFRYYVKEQKIFKDEWLYIHFQKKNMPLNDVDITCNDFWITPSGFALKDNAEVSIAVIEAMNGILSEKDILTEEREYKKKKYKEIWCKRPKEKYIWFKQRIMRLLDKVLIV